jgi:HK97 family phage major capsid protein/HK97 family phage prohead protease
MNKNFSIGAVVKNLGEGLLEAVVASNRRDRHGEILDIQGLNISEYKKDPVVLWAHDYTQPPIGRAESIKKVGDKLITKIKFAINESEFARKIYALYKGKFLNAFSIGFIPLEIDGDTYTKSEMIEFSSVPIPANPDALALAMSKGIINQSDLQIISTKQKGGERNMNLKEILAKKPADLSAEELAFIVENEDNLTEAQKAVFKDVLPEQPEEEAEEEAEEEDETEDKVKALEATVNKIADSLDKIVERKDINVGFNINKNKGDATKEEKFKVWYKGLVNKNFSEYLNIVGKDAMNTTEDGDILPPEEFIAEVSRLEEEYGIATRYANVRRSSAHTLRGIKGGDDVSFVKTSEGGVKPSQRPSYNPYELTYLKYAAIVPVTDELLEDSAIDLWRDITGRFARAAARREDELVFTENDNVSDVYGILNASGVARLSIGDSIADLDGDHLNQMLYEVPTPSMSNGRFYLHRSILGAIQRMKDSDGRYIWSPGIDGGVSGTIWGMPYTLTEVMPSLSDVDDETAFLIFGDLRNTTLGIRVPMQVKYFDTGLVTDPDDNSANLNLLTQDVQAIRARIRMNQVHVHPEAYCVLQTGSLS